MSDTTTDPEVTMPKVIKESKTVNPLLARARLPGDTFRLPSQGIFYTNGELDATVEDGEVHVYPMTAIDEIVISSPAKLFSGEGIIEVLQRCVPSVLQPAELLAQDIDFLLLCLRKVSYGPTIEVERTHVECTAEREEGTEPRKQLFNGDIGKMIAKTKELSPTDITNNYRIELDNGQIIKMQPMRFSSYVKLMQIISLDQGEAGSMDEHAQSDMMLDQLSDMILSVDEVGDQEMIREWLAIITPNQIRKLNDVISGMASWGINTSFKVKCRDCKKQMEVDVPTNPLVLFS